jgi:hypothetical protein
LDDGAETEKDVLRAEGIGDGAEVATDTETGIVTLKVAELLSPFSIAEGRSLVRRDY